MRSGGQIAESEFLPTREKLRAERTGNWLTRRFKRNAERATEDPNLPDNDDLIFAKMGIIRDDEIRKTDPNDLWSRACGRLCQVSRGAGRRARLA